MSNQDSRSSVSYLTRQLSSIKILGIQILCRNEFFQHASCQTWQGFVIEAHASEGRIGSLPLTHVVVRQELKCFSLKLNVPAYEIALFDRLIYMSLLQSTSTHLPVLFRHGIQ
jgi:hypothetical protein